MVAEAEGNVYGLAGEEFNIGSPKQLQRILFEKLGLPTGRRTKTGYSTNAEVLAELAPQHEIVAQILRYRELTKLKSTYVDALPRLVNPRTGRVHTSFNQTVTATGRLSSSEPNLQNIPIRTELGKLIRKAFVAGGPGRVLLGADYSQIELRVLAHISQDEHLLGIFATDQDLHTHTACEIFGVSPGEVSSEMRRLAKVVNFGIPYGISPQGLAQGMGVAVTEARRFMDAYFERFPGIRGYIEEIVEKARRDGFVTTVLGRRRYLPDLHAQSRQVREFAERTAINTPIQGSAADIIKLAMLLCRTRLREERLQAIMTLQVHDELVFEVPEAELEATRGVVVEAMANAFPLCVPLGVEIEAGPNWGEMRPA
jgi:DNA polymerase-1